MLLGFQPGVSLRESSQNSSQLEGFRLSGGKSPCPSGDSHSFQVIPKSSKALPISSHDDDIGAVVAVEAFDADFCRDGGGAAAAGNSDVTGVVGDGDAKIGRDDGFCSVGNAAFAIAVSPSTLFCSASLSASVTAAASAKRGAPPQFLFLFSSSMPLRARSIPILRCRSCSG